MSSVVVLYCVQGDKGEDAKHPNQFTVPRPAGGVDALRLRDIITAFPLQGRGLFHFRFARRAVVGGGFLDLRHPDDRVPVTESGEVVMRVLRLENLRCVSALRPRGAPVSVAPAVGAAAVDAAVATAAAGGGAPRPPAPTLKQRGRQPSLDDIHVRDPRPSSTAEPTARPRAGSGGDGGGGGRTHSVGPVTRSNSILDIDDDDAPAAAPAPASSPPGGVGRVWAAADADLEGKSEHVKAAVMQRRAQDRDRAEAAVKTVGDADRAREAEADAARDSASRLEPRLREWAEESRPGAGPGGRGGPVIPRSIRALLATMHTVMWPGSGWKEVSMGALVEPKRVQFVYKRACIVVHPDKVKLDADADHRYTARFVFEALNTANQKFGEK